jgi:hypothetical protein
MTKGCVVLSMDQHLTVRMTSNVLNLNHRIFLDFFTKELDIRQYGCCVTAPFLATLPTRKGELLYLTVLHSKVKIYIQTNVFAI